MHTLCIFTRITMNKHSSNEQKEQKQNKKIEEARDA